MGHMKASFEDPKRCTICCLDVGLAHLIATDCCCSRHRVAGEVFNFIRFWSMSKFRQFCLLFFFWGPVVPNNHCEVVRSYRYTMSFNGKPCTGDLLSVLRPLVK